MFLGVLALAAQDTKRPNWIWSEPDRTVSALKSETVPSGVVPKLAFGASACLVPDVDGDHVPDIAVGTDRLERRTWMEAHPVPAFDAKGSALQGCVALYSGAAGKQLWKRDAVPGDRCLGRRLASGGDLTGDSVPDVVASANVLDVGTSAVAVLSGRDGSVDAWIESPRPGLDGAIESVLVVSDLDGDERADLLMGLEGRSRVVAISGRTHQVLYERNLPDDGGAHLAPNEVRDVGRYTAIATLARDEDGDGVADFAVALHSGQGNRTIVSLCSGRDGRVVSSIELATDPLGELCLAGARDLDGEGTPDLVLSHADRIVVALCGKDLGALRTYWKGPSQPDSEGFGFQSAFAGDLDGDGTSEVIVGCRDDFFPGGTYRADLFSGRTGERIGGIETRYEQTSVFEGADFDRDGVPELLVGIPGNDELWIIDGKSAKTKDSRWWCQRVLTPMGSYVPKADAK